MNLVKEKYQVQKGITVWLTGLSGSGKSTITEALVKKLKESNPNISLEILDGDEVREHLCKDLSFSKEDRFTNIERIAFLAGKISKHKVLVLVPVIAPYKDARALARSLSDNFCEVFIQASIDTVKNRDPKGLYKKAISGEIKNFTGISDPYEIPENPDILINTETTDIDNACKNIINYLVKNSFLIVENL